MPQRAMARIPATLIFVRVKISVKFQWLMPSRASLPQGSVGRFVFIAAPALHELGI